MIKKYLLIIVTLSLSTGAFSQQKMTIDEIVQQLIQENYSIKIEAEYTRKAQNNVNISSMLPTLSATARQSQNTVGATTNTLGLGATLNWRLFDGLAMFSVYEQQKKQLDASILMEMSNLEELIRQVKIQYYLIVSLQSRAKVARESVELSRRRYEETLLRYSIEALSGLEMKLAKTDLNADSTALIRQIEAVDVAYITLNKMLNFGYDQRNYIKDTIIIKSPMEKEQTERIVVSQNTDILLAQKNIEIADLGVKLSKATQYPTLDFTAGYNYNAVNELPASSFRNSQGANWGFTLGVKLFDGLNIRRNISNSKIDSHISNLKRDDVVNNVLAAFNSQYVNYSNNLQLIDFETENSAAMRLNLDVALERYRLGELSGIDFRNIQQQYLSAEDRKINALYLAKSSEISLQALAGIIAERK